MSLTLSVTTRPGSAGQTSRVALAGALDTSTAAELEKALALLFEGPTRILIFDLEQLSFLSSGGVRVLLAARKRVLERNGSCVMLHAQPRIEKTFEIIEALGGLQFFKDDETLDAFLAALQTPKVA